MRTEDIRGAVPCAPHTVRAPRPAAAVHQAPPVLLRRQRRLLRDHPGPAQQLLVTADCTAAAGHHGDRLVLQRDESSCCSGELLGTGRECHECTSGFIRCWTTARRCFCALAARVATPQPSCCAAGSLAARPATRRRSSRSWRTRIAWAASRCLEQRESSVGLRRTWLCACAYLSVLLVRQISTKT